MESLWRKKANAEVALACDRMQEEHSAQMAERAAYLGALHAGRLRSMQDARLLQRHQLQAELLEAHERHAQQLEHVRQDGAYPRSPACCKGMPQHCSRLRKSTSMLSHMQLHRRKSALNQRLAEVSATASLF